MKMVLKLLGALVALVLVAGGGGLVWAKSTASSMLDKKYEIHTVDFPIPYPLTEAEIAALRAERAPAPGAEADGGVAMPEVDPLAGVDLKAIAEERARARGKHLVEARYACVECHGRDFGGGTMVDSPPIGQLFGMNLTSGKGGVVSHYTAADWDRVVRHGVLPTGKGTPMPSLDFVSMSDRELSDIITYIRSMPPVDKEMPRPTLGPLGAFLMATGKLPMSADRINHQQGHLGEPPAEAPNAEFGKHLVAVCAGCHGPELVGGPIPGGPPEWAPAANLTLLQGWTYDDFRKALLEAKSKDGRTLRAPMDGMKTYAANITDTEFQAMWEYLKTVPPKPTPAQ